MPKPIILFDFDGVIADSFQQAFGVRKMMCPLITEDTYRKYFEGNIYDADTSDVTHTEHCRHDIDFFAEYMPKLKQEAPIVAGMQEVVVALEKKYTLVIISSTTSNAIKEYLIDHNLNDHFTQILGKDVSESKVEKMNIVFETYGVTPSDCVFITDTLGDLREAEQVHVGAIGVTWGYHTQETLLRGKSFRIVEKPGDLVYAVRDYFDSSM
jgi:phosphoglycolate phosphatase